MVGPPIALTAPTTPEPQQTSTAVTRYAPAAPGTHTGTAVHVTPAPIPAGLAVQPAPQPAAIVVPYGCVVTMDGKVVSPPQQQQQVEEKKGVLAFKYQDGSVRVLRDQEGKYVEDGWQGVVWCPELGREVVISRR
jgi:hypothetical protein